MAVFYLLESFVMRTRLKLISEIVLIIQMKEADIFVVHLFHSCPVVYSWNHIKIITQHLLMLADILYLPIRSCIYLMTTQQCVVSRQNEIQYVGR